MYISAFISKQILFFINDSNLEFMKMILKQVHQNIMKVMLHIRLMIKSMPKNSIMWYVYQQVASMVIRLLLFTIVTNESFGAKVDKNVHNEV